MEYRGFLIVSDGTFGYKEIKPIGRGSVPGSLRGMFTTPKFAMKAIDMEKSRKETSDGEASISV